MLEHPTVGVDLWRQGRANLVDTTLSPDPDITQPAGLDPPASQIQVAKILDYVGALGWPVLGEGGVDQPGWWRLGKRLLVGVHQPVRYPRIRMPGV